MPPTWAGRDAPPSPVLLGEQRLAEAAVLLLGSRGRPWAVAVLIKLLEQLESLQVQNTRGVSG